MKILILGGTKYLGPALVHSARARGHEITLFNRGKSNPAMFPDLETLIGDRGGDLTALAGRSWDAVVDTSAYVPTEVRLAAELLKDSVRQYLFISTLSVYARRTLGIDESGEVSTLPDGTDGDELTRRNVTNANYGALKALCERAAEAVMPGRVTNIRPGLIVGPLDRSRRFHYWPWRVNLGGEILAPGPRDGRVQFIDVRDVADWTVKMAEDGHAGVYNCIGPEGTLIMEEMIYACKAVTSAVGSLSWVDEPFLLENGFRTWSPIPIWTSYSVPEYAEHNAVSRAKAMAHGLTFRPLGDTCQAVLEDVLGMDEKQLWPREATLGRERELLAAWRDRDA